MKLLSLNTITVKLSTKKYLIILSVYQKVGFDDTHFFMYDDHITYKNNHLKYLTLKWLFKIMFNKMNYI